MTISKTIDWPDSIPAATCARLERIMSGVAAANAKKPTLKHSDMRRDAKAIAKQASKLLDMVRRFEKSYWVEAINQKPKDVATQAICSADDSLNGAEQELIRAGMSQHSLQFPLHGLIGHMSELDSSGKSQRPTEHLPLYALTQVAKEFKRVQLDASKDKDSAFFEACRIVLRSCGFNKSDDAIDHYLRKIINAKS